MFAGGVHAEEHDRGLTESGGWMKIMENNPHVDEGDLEDFGRPGDFGDLPAEPQVDEMPANPNPANEARENSPVFPEEHIGPPPYPGPSFILL